MLGFFKVATIKKLPKILVDSYLALSNGVVLHLNGVTNEVTRLAPDGNGANFGDLAYVCNSPDGKYIYWPTGGTTYRSFLYKREGDVLTQINTPGDNVQGTASFSPDGKVLVTNAAVNCWRVNGDDTFTSFAAIPWVQNSGAGRPAWTPDSKYLLMPNTQQFFARMFLCNQAGLSWTEVPAISTLPRTPFPLNVGDYTFMFFYDDTNAPEIWTFSEASNSWTSGTVSGITTVYVRDVAQTPDGAYLTIAHANGIDLYKKLGLGSYQRLGNLVTPGTAVSSCAWTLDGKFLAVGMNNGASALRFFMRNGDAMTEVAVPSSVGGWTNSGTINHMQFS